MPLYDPATGAPDRHAADRRRSRRRRRVACGQGRLPRLAGHLALAAHPSHVPLPGPVDATPTSSRPCITAEHGKVLSDALGEVARGLEIIEFACGIPHLLKGELTEQCRTGIDVYSDPPAPRRRGRHHAVQLPGHGPDVDVRQSPSPAATRSSSSRRRRTRRPSLLLAELLAEAGLPDGVLQRRPRRQGRRRRAPRAPRHRGGQLRRLDADRPPRLRDRHPARQAGPGPRRGQEPHGRAARRRHRPGRRRRRAARATARPASAAWPSRVVRRRRRRGRPTWSPRSPSASHGSRSARAPTTDVEMGPLVTAAHRDRVARLRRRSASRRAPSWSSTAGTWPSTAPRTASSSGRACSTT